MNNTKNINKIQKHSMFQSLQHSQLSILNQIINDKNMYLQEKQNNKMMRQMKKMKKKYDYYILQHSNSSQKFKAADVVCTKIEFNFLQTIKLQVFSKLKNQQKSKQQIKCQYSQKQKRNQFQTKELKTQQIKLNINILQLYLNNIIKSNRNRMLDFSFCCLQKLNKKSIDPKQMTYLKIHNKLCQQNEQNLQKIRILEYSNRNCVQLNLQEHSIDCELEEFSIIQSGPQLQAKTNWSKQFFDDNKQQIVKRNQKQEKQLQIMLKNLQIQIENKMKRYAKIKQNLMNQLQQINKQQVKNYSDLQSSETSQISQKSKTFNIELSPDVSCTVRYDEAVVTQSNDIEAFIQRNKQLQQEIDKIRQTVQELINLSKAQKNMNPDLIGILKQVKQILEPTPLGFSLMID